MSNETETQTQATTATPAEKVVDKSNKVNPKYGIPVPLYLKCVKTGKETVYTSPKYIEARIKKAGSLEKLVATYTCKGATPKEKKVVEPVAATSDNTTPSADTTPATVASA